MKVVILGSTSKTAYALYPKIKSQSTEIESYWLSSSEQPGWFQSENWTQINYNNLDGLVATIKTINPDFVINLSAYTNVDSCEENKFESHHINYELPKTLAEHSKDSYHLIHISTDYVFDGKKGLYEISDERSLENIGWYALSKRDSEDKVLESEGTIIRTNVLYDSGEYKPNFLTWLKSAITSSDEILIVYDQFNNPTHVDDLAQSILYTIQKSVKGIVHTGGKDWISRWELAQVFLLSLSDDESKNNIKPTSSSSLNQPSPRPKFGGLATIKSEHILDMKFIGIYDFILETSEIPKDSIHYEILKRLIYVLRLLDNDLRKRITLDIVRNGHGTISINISNKKILAEIEIGKSSYSGMLYIYDSQSLNLVDGEIYDDDTIKRFLKSVESFA